MQLSPGTSRRRLVDPTQPPTLIEPETAVLWAGATEAGSRPASPSQPSLHYATDTPAVTLWDGSTWRSMGGATLPSASAAGQMLVATGSGTSYAARGRVLSGTLAERDALSPVREGDQWYVSSDEASGTLWKRVNGAWRFRSVGATADDVLAELGGIKAPSSPNAADALVYDGATWQAASILPATVSYALTGGSHDYAADAEYTDGGTGTPYTISGLLGDGVSVPKFYVLEPSLVAALARTTVPSLRLTMTAANGGGPFLSYDSSGDGATSLVIPVPYWIERSVAWRVTARIALNFAAIGLGSAGTDFVTTRFGLFRRNYADGAPETAAAVDVFTSYPAGSGELSEGCFIDGVDTYASRVVLTSETSGGLNVRDVRITMSGASLKVETGPEGGALVSRIHRSTARRRGARPEHTLALVLGQSRATPLAGYYVELRALAFEVL